MTPHRYVQSEDHLWQSRPSAGIVSRHVFWFVSSMVGFLGSNERVFCVDQGTRVVLSSMLFLLGMVGDIYQPEHH